MHVEPSFVLYALLLDQGYCLRAYILYSWNLLNLLSWKGGGEVGCFPPLVATGPRVVSDGGASTPSNSGSDTDTWSTSGESSSSQPSVRSCSTEASR